MSDIDIFTSKPEPDTGDEEKKSTAQLNKQVTGTPRPLVSGSLPATNNSPTTPNPLMTTSAIFPVLNELEWNFKNNSTIHYIPEYILSNPHSTQPHHNNIYSEPTQLQCLQELDNSLGPNNSFSKDQQNFKYLSGQDKIGEYLASGANFPLGSDDIVKKLDRTLDPHLKVRIQSLPVLDNLACQILRTLTKQVHEETLAIVSQPHTDRGQAYRMLIQLFEQTKQIYSEDHYLSAEVLGLNFSKTYTRVIQKANLAVFMATIYGSTQLGFQYLNEYFLDILIPDSGRLLKPHGVLYLDLKTQAYISAVAYGNKSRLEVLEELFPENLDEILLNRRRTRNWKQIAPSEIDFIARCNARKDRLYEMENNQELAETYVWLNFLREISEFICKNLDYLISPHLAINQTKPDNILLRFGSTVNNYISPDNTNEDFDSDILFLNEAPTTNNQQSQSPSSQRIQKQNSEHAENGQNTQYNNQPEQDQRQSANPAVNTLSSITKSLAPSPRRPWSKEEEITLLEGLEAVKGPHWSQILEMYGRGGRINEVLKDRNQVQLKDKARNLKLYYLKSNFEIPYYLQLVTGDIKSRKKTNRASRASKKKNIEY